MNFANEYTQISNMIIYSLLLKVLLILNNQKAIQILSLRVCLIL